MDRGADQSRLGDIAHLGGLTFTVVQGIVRLLVLPGHRLTLGPPGMGGACLVEEGFHLGWRRHSVAGLDRHGQLFGQDSEQVAFRQRAHAHQDQAQEPADGGLNRQSRVQILLPDQTLGYQHLAQARTAHAATLTERFGAGNP